MVLASLLVPVPGLTQDVRPQALPEPEPEELELPRYEVELLVFRNLAPGIAGKEVWPREVVPTALDSALAARELEEMAAAALLEEPLVPELAEMPADEEEPEAEAEAETEAEPPEELVDDAAILDEYFRVPDFQLVPVEQLQLAELRERMTELEIYEPLFHIAWIQSGYARAEARPFDLPPGEEVVAEQIVFVSDDLVSPPAAPEPEPEPELDPEGEAHEATGPAYWLEATASEEPEPGEVLSRVVGSATLWLGTYLHLDLDLEMETEILAQPFVIRANEAGEGAERFLLQQKRRVRRRQLHYFDHPKFGVIAQVSRYEPEPPGDGEADPETDSEG